MPLKLITGPQTEPLSLAEAKAQCKVEHDDEDDLISALITSVREQAEHLVGRPFITQTWELVLDVFPAGAIALGKANVLSIESVTYIDHDGESVVLDADLYSLDAADTSECWLHPAHNTLWPTTLDTANAVRVRITCGYGNAAAVPGCIKAWMKLAIGNLHANRESTVIGASVVELPHIERMLDRERIWRP